MSRLPLAVFLAGLASCASAATFTVTNVDEDQPDVSPGDGECKIPGLHSPSHWCTLRAAIMEANALPGADTIIVPYSAHIVLTLTGRNENAAATGDLDVTDPVTISTPNVSTSARAIIDANGIDRVFDIRPGAGNVSLINLSIRNGNANDATTYVGGGIRADGNGTGSTLSVLYCELTGNAANSGGAIWVGSVLNRSLYLFDSAVHGNVITNLGYTNVDGSAIKDADGAAAAGASMTIRRSTLYSNLALGGSGHHAALSVHEPLLVENSTFSANAPNAVYVFAAYATLNHVTITGSQTGYAFDGNSFGNTSTLANTIIADNTVSDCSFTGSYGYSHGYSLDSDGSCNLGGFGVGNLPLSDPRLRPLALRFGDTPVHDLGTGSPAIDHGDPAMLNNGGTCLTRDQDNLPRPQDGDGGGARCDMGAVEFIDKIFVNGFESLVF